MFDLFRNRERTKKILMGGILLMVSASMLLYLVPNYSNGSSTGSDAVVAKIGSEEITEADARRVIQAQTRGHQIPAEVIPNYVPTLIDQMIGERAMEYEAHKMGIQVSDQDVADQLR